MPPSMARTHSVFHVSMLNPYMKAGLTDGGDIIIDAGGTVEQVVESIFQHQRRSNDRTFLSKLVGSQTQEAEWMTREDLKTTKDTLNKSKHSLHTRTSY